MKILHLTIKKKWFDLIAANNKIVEYREVKDYWRKRLTEKVYVPSATPIFKIFDEIHFRNGYRKNSPFMRIEFVGITVIDARDHKPANGEILKGRQYAIFLGQILCG